MLAATSYVVLRLEICELKEAEMMQSAENEARRVRTITGVADVYQKAGETSLGKPNKTAPDFAGRGRLDDTTYQQH